MKRRKFALAGAFLAALLAVAFAASSVGAATKSAAKWNPHAKVTKSKIKPAYQGQASFVNSGAKDPGMINKVKHPDNYLQSSGKITNRHIPGKMGKNGSAPTSAAASSAAASAGTPVATSLPITTANYTAAQGLNAWQQWIFGGYALVPPDQALAEGNGFVLEAVNNLFQISDTNFGHVTNIESMEQFWAPAIAATGYDCVSDPKAHYDYKTRKWYITELAYGLVCLSGAPGSAVFIAVSTTSDPLGPYNIYVLDVSFDGTTCGPDGCIGDQPLLGMNANALFISTNSFDWDSPAFNGTQLYIIDSTALAAGFLFPNVYYQDFGVFSTPDAPSGCGSLVYPANGYCWYSVQPATSPNMSFAQDRAGTEFMLSAEDWFGSTDTGIVLWAITQTSAISSVVPGAFIEISGVEIDGQTYGAPVTDTPFFAPYAEQPSAGLTPFCDFVYGPFCTPGPIANNDDRMNEVKSVKTGTHAAYISGAVNTKVLVSDPIHHLHRRSGIAYWQVSPTCWFGIDLCGGAINWQGYVANWNNDVIFPAIGLDTTGTHGAMVYTLTGNTNYPSVAVSKFTTAAKISSIPVVLAGQDVNDDFCTYDIFACGGPRWGDYSAAVGDGHTVYLATEYIPYAGCDLDEYISTGGECFGTRNPFANYGTGLVKVNV